MAYGFYGWVVQIAEGRHGCLPKGARSQIFLCTLIRIAWVIAACGSALAADQLGVTRWVFLALLYAQGVAACCLSSMTLSADLTFGVFFSLAFALLGVLFEGPLLLPREDSALHDTSFAVRTIFPTFRRLMLATLAALALCVDFSFWRAALLVTLLCLDWAATTRLLLLAGVEPDRRGHPKLVLVRRDSAQRCVFNSNTDGPSPLTLVSHPGFAIINVHDSPLIAAGWSSLPLAVGPAEHALVARWDGGLVLCSGADADRVMSISFGRFVQSNHVRATNHATGRHMQTRPGRPSSREFVFNDDQTISPLASQELVLGVQFEPKLTVVMTATRPTRGRRLSRRESFQIGGIAPSDALTLLPHTHMPLYDALEECVLQLTEQLSNCIENEAAKQANAHALAKAEAQQVLLNVCKWLLGSAPALCTTNFEVGGLPLPSTLPNGISDASHTLVTALLTELNFYLPIADDDGSSDRTLTKELLRLANDPEAAASRSVEEVPAHPLRAVSLARGLDTRIWDGSRRKPAPSSKGNGVIAFNADSFYSFSHDARSVTWFISHSWADDCSQKVKHLRFLVVVNLLGSLFVACPLVALYFVPLGVALDGVQGISWWVAPLLPLVLLASACSWVGLSYVGLMPSTLTPWATSSATVWIGTLRHPCSRPQPHPFTFHRQICLLVVTRDTADKCCVDQENMRGFLEGGLRDSLLSSEKMAAFLGPKCTFVWFMQLRPRTFN
jgi:hypothetical protein